MGGAVVFGALVARRGDAPEILRPAEAAFDEVAFLAAVLVVPDRLFAVGFARNDGPDFPPLQVGAK
jgi:hypothetical protein